jgi:hypothetical protein
MKHISGLAIALALTFGAFGQTTATQPAPAAAPPVANQLQNVTLPTYVLMGFSYNQFASPAVSGLFSAIEPESQSVGLLASESIDMLPVKYTDPTSKKIGYLFSGSVRFGQHKVILNTDKGGATFHPSFMLTVGGDAGASFSSSGTAPSSVSVGFSGSLTIGGWYHFKPHWGAGLAIRALYMSGIGPGGSGAWNPVVEPAVVYAK